MALTSCQDVVTYDENYDNSELVSTGAPVIEGVYDADNTETPLASAGLGEMVVLKGQNLSNVKVIRVNDREADLAEVYATAATLYFIVPETMPTDITNRLYLETALGSTEIDFKVDIPALEVNGLYNEFALPGSEVDITGRYFDVYGFGSENQNATVTMNGTALEIKEVTPTALTVVIPEEASDNSVIVVSYQGSEGVVTIQLPYRQTDQIVWNLSTPDNYGFWSGTDLITDGANAGDPSPLYGPYFRVRGTYTAWSWNQLLCGGFNLDAEVAAHPEDYWLKFEVNSNAGTPFYDSGTVGYLIQINGGQYAWNPSSANSFNTYGAWYTVRLDLAAVATNGLTAGWTNLYWIMQPNSDWTVDHSFANVRIEKKNN